MLVWLPLVACVHKTTLPPAVSGPSSSLAGAASWYGAELAGRPTASGVPFRPNERTAAHRTLPFGTIVRVTHAETGASVVVVINDRGPFVAGRVIDLSEAAAEAIGMKDAGVAPVRIAVLGCDDRYPSCR
ncbi:MAG: septal ring lytic transglycosylase RlpA family protein [Myxococcota bacterium]